MSSAKAIFGLLAAFVLVAPAAYAASTAFEGARIIVGDGTVIENGTLVVDGDKIVAVGEAGRVTVPQGAARVAAKGKTLMPTLNDTHVHLGRTPEAIAEDLRKRAVYGIGAAQSLGSDPYELLPLRAKIMPGHARYFSAGRGITRPEPGRGNIPHWIQTADEARAAVRELGAQKVDIHS